MIEKREADEQERKEKLEERLANMTQHERKVYNSNLLKEKEKA